MVLGEGVLVAFGRELLKEGEGAAGIPDAVDKNDVDCHVASIQMGR